MRNASERRGDSGSILIVVVLFLATAIAALAAIGSSRVVSASRHQAVMEDESRATVEAYGSIHMALNVVNTSAYDGENRNLVLRAAIANPVGDTQETLEWLRAPAGVTFGVIEGTDVRVYRARDYVQRLQKLRGDDLMPVDLLGRSDKFFVLEAIGQSGDTVRVVSALVRETQSFSSFVFFQDEHTLGVSGDPRGLIHANTDLAFYFPDGNYTDTVSSVGGFSYKAGATPQNTMLSDANDSARPIDLQAVNFADLRAKSGLYVGPPGLDAEIEFFSDGSVKITPFTQPTYVQVEVTYTEQRLMGYEDVTHTETIQVQIGTTTETRTREVITGYATETYEEQVPIYETVEVTETRQVPVFESQETTCERWVQVFVPFAGDPGGTSIGEDDAGIPGDYQWVLETYPCTEQVIIGYTPETYTTTQQVQIGTTTETLTRQVPIYGTEIYTVEVPLYETTTIEVTEVVPVYNEVTETRTENQYQQPVALEEQVVWVNDTEGMIFVDGRITEIGGDLNGRLTIVGTDKVRITDSIRYVDGGGDPAMLYGADISNPYQRNPEYDGNSVLGVIAKDDILFTWEMPELGEINGTLLSVEGRVGTDGVLLDENGHPFRDSDAQRERLLSAEEYALEAAYDMSGDYRSEPFVKESLRRLGGLISDERIVETFLRGRGDGTAYVDVGFKRGSMRYDANLRFNPPPEFVEVPQPAVAAFLPVYFSEDER